MLDKILRIQQEPFTYITEHEVHTALSEQPLDYLLDIEQQLQQIASATTTIEMPCKAIFVDKHSEGDFRVMPCVVHYPEDSFKTVKLIGTNLTEQVINDQITVGKAFCLHPADNYITHIVEACLLSSARTGLCATLALKYLAKKQETLTIVGCGRVGFYCAFYALALGKTSHITFIDKIHSRAQHMQATFAKTHSQCQFEAAHAPEAITTDALIIATNSQQPLFDPHHIEAGLIISLGADNHIQSELSTLWAPQLDTLFVDSKDAQHVGDLKSWLAQEQGFTGEIVDLITLIRGQSPAKASHPLVFISTGTALFDNLTLRYLVKNKASS